MSSTNTHTIKENAEASESTAREVSQYIFRNMLPRSETEYNCLSGNIVIKYHNTRVVSTNEPLSSQKKYSNSNVNKDSTSHP